MTLKAPVVVVYVPDTGTFGKQNQWERRSMLGASHHDNLAGVLAAGTSEVGACVHRIRLTDTEAFEREIRHVGLQSAPTIALMTESKLVVWPDGIEGELSSFDNNLDDGAVIIDLAAINHALNDFYEGVGRQTKKWWKNAKLRITVENPETTVQFALWVFLRGRYGRVARIKTEETIGNGRADITVVPIYPGPKDQSSVLELKALRDVRTPRTDEAQLIKISPRANIDWACSGIQQTAAYRDDNDMDGAFLCLYDFCEKDSTDVDEAVKPHALQYNVQHRRYWITASHEEHRKDRYPLPE
ncbi:hypothetical protein [Nitrosospira briensis]|uniref:hypothetical protein n=1 Tax=Nitrosospira briensis TaxID=35799 RepID=UPI0012E21F4F|nr:hypothetical protein [Nitrosospira briensis]